MKRAVLIGSLVGLFFGCGSIHGQSAVVFDGTSLFNEFGAAGTLVDGAYNVTLNGWGNTAFRSAEPADAITPQSINWAAGPVSFDYRINSGTVQGLYNFNLMLRVEGANPPQQPLAAMQWPSLTPLIADGQWHTFSVNFAGFHPDYAGRVTEGVINPALPYNVILFLQGGNAADLNISVDNLVIPVPEPAGQAAILALLVLGLAFWRRARC